MSGFADRGGWWVVGQAMLFVAIAVAAWSDGPAISDSALWAVVLGAALFATGLGLGVAAFAALGFTVSVFPAPEESAHLATNGIYRYVRHPIYGGVVVSFVGGMLLTDSLVGLVLSLLLIPFFLGKAAHEEALLIARYPEYAAYRQRVAKKLLPFVV